MDDLGRIMWRTMGLSMTQDKGKCHASCPIISMEFLDNLIPLTLSEKTLLHGVVHFLHPKLSFVSPTKMSRYCTKLGYI